MKKRTASPLFISNAPLVISLAQINECLPLDNAIFTNIEGTKEAAILLTSMAQNGQILSKLDILQHSVSKKDEKDAVDTDSLYKAVRAALKK
jgi:hypothetical protein